jgi:alpha-N-acetylglucosaminidase
MGTMPARCAWVCASFALLAAAAAAAASIPFEFAGRGSAEAVRGLVSRAVSPDAAALFELSIVPGLCAAIEAPPAVRSPLCFRVSAAGARVRVEATSGVELARGVGSYLRRHHNMSFAWKRTGGSQNAFAPPSPRALAALEPEVQFKRTNISYYQNVVASSYTHAWWDFADWEFFLDWAALSGINVQLAYTGQEEVFRKALAEFGVNDTTFGNWSNGPAWLGWSRGQSMHGVGVSAQQPLSRTFMTKQWSLQQQILARMRELGIVPVLPAFQGNVPPMLKTELFPTANISVQGTGRHYAAWLDATDPLFQKIGDAYMKHLCADFGCTDHWYEADGYFTSGNPPWLASGESAERESGLGPVAAAAKAHAERAYMAINQTDPDAIWLYQGWILPGAAPFTEGLVAAVEPGRLVISDMRCESNGCEWSDDYGASGSFYGAPFIWGSLHDFGGVDGMWGSFPELTTGPLVAFCNATTVTGVGMLPEGIDQNSPWYTLLLDTNWVAVNSSRAQAISCSVGDALLDVEAWVEDWALQRYGGGPGEDAAKEAWALLASTVYSDAQTGGTDREDQADALTSYPVGAAQENVAPKPDWYNTSAVFAAWELLVSVAEQRLEADTATPLPSTLNYDLCNTGREVLAKMSNRLFNATTAATSVSSLAAAMAPMMEMLEDADELLCADVGFSMAEWIEKSRLWGDTTAEKERLEWAARAQPTTWLPACPPAEQPSSNRTRGICGARSDLADYSAKQWGGLVGTYYRGRYDCYNRTASAAFAAGTGLDESFASAYNRCIDQWSWQWQNQNGDHADDDTQRQLASPICAAPTGDAVAISRKLIAKYRKHLAQDLRAAQWKTDDDGLVKMKPSWPVNYSLAGSTMTFPDGNHSGFDNASRAAQWAKYGMVVYGWELRVCLTAQRGAGCEHAGAEAAMDEQARRLKSLNPSIKVIHYRNSMIALSSFADQCTEMNDPRTVGSYLKAGDKSDGRTLNTPADPRSIMPCLPSVLPPGCRLPWQCKQVQQDQFYRDFANSSAADFFVSTVIGHAANMTSCDGVWFDDVSGCYDNGLKDVCHREILLKGYTPARIAAISAAMNATILRAEQMLHSKGKWSFNTPSGFVKLPTPTNVSAQCVSALEAGAAMAASGAPTTMYVDYFAPPSGGGPTTAFDFRQRLAAFLLVRGDYSFFGHGWITDMPPVWFPEWNWVVGLPLGNMTRSGNTFSRGWSKGDVSLDCDTFTASFTFKAAG